MKSGAHYSVSHLFVSTPEIVIGSNFDNVDFARAWPWTETIFSWHHPHGLIPKKKINKTIVRFLYTNDATRKVENIPGQIQSPRGILARISTVP